MKLGATITSERGRPVTKTGNERIKVSLLDEKGREKYLILYYDTFMHVYEIVNGKGAGRIVLDTSKE